MNSSTPQDTLRLNNKQRLQQIELALKESESQFRSFVENSFDVIFILDANGTFRFVSPSWEQHFGYPASEVTGKQFAPFAHPDDVQPCFSYLQEIMTTGRPGTSPVYRVKCADGSWKKFVANGSRFIDAYGEMLFHGIGRDITVQEQILSELKASEERYRAIVNTQQEFLNRSLPGGVLTFVNDAFCRSVGIPREELLGKSFLPFVHEEDRARLVKSLAELTPANPSLETTDRLVYPDGNLRWQNWTSTAIFDNAGKIVEYQSVGRDVTEQKKNLDALDYVNECFNQALTGAEHILYRLNMKTGSYDYLSPAFERITGYPVADFQKNGIENLRRLVHQDDRAVIDIVDEALRNRTGNTININYEFRLKKADGDYCWLHDYTTACFNANGELECFFGSAYDLTARKQSEQLLQASEDQYRRIVATANEGIAITDRDYHITYVNNRLAEMLGYQPEELLGIYAASLLSDSERDKFDATVSLRKQGISGFTEYEHRRKDGSLVWLLTSSTPVMASDGTFQGGFSMFTDLTDRRQAEKALQQAHDELEQRVKDRTAELASANEQIKLMSFQLIRAEELERGRIAAELHDQVGQSLLLAKMNLDLLANDIASKKDRRIAANISALLESSIDDIRSLTFDLRLPLLETAGLEAALQWLCAKFKEDFKLQIDFTYSCKPPKICSEKRYSLFQAIRELLLNVAKHGKVDQAQLSVKTQRGSLIVTIRDTGAGFEPAAYLQRLVSVASFGIFNVQQRIKQLGGSFEVISAPGKGTTAYISIPLDT